MDQNLGRKGVHLNVPIDTFLTFKELARLRNTSMNTYIVDLMTKAINKYQELLKNENK